LGIEKTDMKKTFREGVIDDIFKFSNETNSFELIEKKYKSIDKKIIVGELIQVGIMPEVFDHDSSEEKLWSKVEGAKRKILEKEEASPARIEREIDEFRRKFKRVFSKVSG